MHIKNRKPLKMATVFFKTCISMSMLKNSLGILGSEQGVVFASEYSCGITEDFMKEKYAAYL